MKLLEPAFISAEILNLIDRAKEKVILVSPYNKLQYYKKLQATLNRAMNRGVEIIYIVREPEKNDDNASLTALTEFGIQPLMVSRLHCKLYMNETTGIVTSMNLLPSSDDFAIEIGYKTETEQEYKELHDFFETYVLRNLVDMSVNNQFSIETFVEIVNNNINEVVRKPQRKAFVNDQQLRFNHNGGYTFFLENNKLTFNTWLKQRTLDYLDSHRALLSGLPNWEIDWDLKALSNHGKYLKGVHKEIHSTNTIHEIEIKQANRYHNDIIELIVALDKVIDAAMMA